MEISDLIATMIAKEMLPLSFVESRSFRMLLKRLAPWYIPISRKKLTNLMEQKYTKAADLVKKDLSEQKVNVTGDLWKDELNNKSFLGKNNRKLSM